MRNRFRTPCALVFPFFLSFLSSNFFFFHSVLYDGFCDLPFLWFCLGLFVIGTKAVSCNHFEINKQGCGL